MKITVLREKLKEALRVVGRVSQKNLALPILNSVLLEAEKNFLCLKTTDLELGIKYWLLAKVEKEGRFACPFKFFQGLVENLAEEKIVLRSEERKLWLETESFQAQVQGLETEDFPIIPEPESKASFSLRADQLLEGLAQVVEMASPSLVKPEISGVNFSFAQNSLKLAATDSFRLAEKTIRLPEVVAEEFSFILPQRSCRELINIFATAGELEFRFCPNQILLESSLPETPHPQVHFVSKLIEGEYPSYQSIIPQEFRFTALCQKSDFSQRLKIVSLLSNKINEIKLKIDPGKQEINFSSENPEIGQSSSRLAAQIAGEGSEVSFNWRFLTDGLNQIKGKELAFALSKNEGPALLRSDQDPSYLYLLMPLKPS